MREPKRANQNTKNRWCNKLTQLYKPGYCSFSTVEARWWKKQTTRHAKLPTSRSVIYESKFSLIATECLGQQGIHWDFVDSFCDTSRVHWWVFWSGIRSEHQEVSAPAEATVTSDTWPNKKEPIRTQRTADATNSLGPTSKAIVASVPWKLGYGKNKQQGMQNCQQTGQFFLLI